MVGNRSGRREEYEHTKFSLLGSVLDVCVWLLLEAEPRQEDPQLWLRTAIPGLLHPYPRQSENKIPCTSLTTILSAAFIPTENS